jgi:hypothetical protein
MRNVPLFITGIILIIVSIILLIVGLVNKSSNNGAIDTMDKTIKICRDKKAFDNANDGDLIYLSGQYDMSKDKGFDSDFDMRFKDSIIKRSYEKFQRSYTRLLNEDETITKENNLNSNDVKNYDHEKHHLRCKYNNFTKLYNLIF